MILTRWFTFAAPPKCGCLWFREILRSQGIAVFGETEISPVDGYELKKYRDSFRHHVPGRLPSVTIRRCPEKWLKSYLHHFEGKRMAITCIDHLIGLDIGILHAERVFKTYESTFTIDLDNEPHKQVCHIFEALNIPHDASSILSLDPVNVTDFSKEKDDE